MTAETATITIETASIRFAFNAGDATQGAEAKGHLLQAGDVLHLCNQQQIRKFVFISAVAATPAVLQVTPYW